LSYEIDYEYIVSLLCGKHKAFIKDEGISDILEEAKIYVRDIHINDLLSE